MNGIVLIDKPSGVTSFSVTAAVKRKLNCNKAGHAGTLDPLATGVLPVMLGRCTRFIDLGADRKKHYQAGLVFGMTTDTLDCDGQVLTEQPVAITRKQLLALLPRFTGAITQIPPMYAAVKKGGVPLYKLARQGVQVERKPRQVQIDRLDLIDFHIAQTKQELDTALLDIVCSKGTYVRTLIDDLGRALGCGAYMHTLRRIASGGFEISQCIPLEQFLNSAQPTQYLLPPQTALTGLCRADITPKQATLFQNGGQLFLDRVRLQGDTPLAQVWCGRLLGVATVDRAQGLLCPKCLL